MHIAAKVALESPVQNQRRATRENILVSTTMRASGNHGVDIVIRNISSLGFMAETNGEFEADQRVRVRLPALGTIIARIVWVKDEQFGAEFAEEVELSKLRAILAATGAAPPKRARATRGKTRTTPSGEAPNPSAPDSSVIIG
ncbi:PilZ domain-containing protein [Sphingomonas sp. C3-2]|uniref:PilZ domain-containing protein n=1 Tax=Sphingomonas sp. C3-2 TaxID=3062169 RepID=UPI00294ABA24|nr:PilZ domain-containing protein [Sphingomonas sp. C3-2]WOK35533.1 PilZ domain-containing protein [Sphingomonas sp. C3-2]